MAQMLSNLPDGQADPKSLKALFSGQQPLAGSKAYPLGLPSGANFAVPSPSDPQTVGGYMPPGPGFTLGGGFQAMPGMTLPSFGGKGFAGSEEANAPAGPATIASLQGLDNGGNELPASTGGGGSAGAAGVPPDVAALLNPTKKRGQPPSAGPASTIGSY
jgi:hypothetical protein